MTTNTINVTSTGTPDIAASEAWTPYEDGNPDDEDYDEDGCEKKEEQMKKATEDPEDVFCKNLLYSPYRFKKKFEMTDYIQSCILDIDNCVGRGNYTVKIEDIILIPYQMYLSSEKTKIMKFIVFDIKKTETQNQFIYLDFKYSLFSKLEATSWNEIKHIFFIDIGQKGVVGHSRAEYDTYSYYYQSVINNSKMWSNIKNDLDQKSFILLKQNIIENKLFNDIYIIETKKIIRNLPLLSLMVRKIYPSFKKTGYKDTVKKEKTLINKKLLTDIYNKRKEIYKKKILSDKRLLTIKRHEADKLKKEIEKREKISNNSEEIENELKRIQAIDKIQAVIISNNMIKIHTKMLFMKTYDDDIGVSNVFSKYSLKEFPLGNYEIWLTTDGDPPSMRLNVMRKQGRIDDMYDHPCIERRCADEKLFLTDTHRRCNLCFGNVSPLGDVIIRTQQYNYYDMVMLILSVLENYPDGPYCSVSNFFDNLPSNFIYKYSKGKAKEIISKIIDKEKDEIKKAFKEIKQVEKIEQEEKNVKKKEK